MESKRSFKNYNESVKLYADLMQKSFQKYESYFDHFEFMQIHLNSKKEAMSKVTKV